MLLSLAYYAMDHPLLFYVMLSIKLFIKHYNNNLPLNVLVPLFRREKTLSTAADDGWTRRARWHALAQ